MGNYGEMNLKIILGPIKRSNRIIITRLCLIWKRDKNKRKNKLFGKKKQEGILFSLFV